MVKIKWLFLLVQLCKNSKLLIQDDDDLDLEHLDIPDSSQSLQVES